MAKPAPELNEVLVKVHAASVTRGDVRLRKLPFLLARLFGFRRKAMLGHEFAGQIEAVGPSVTQFKVGERVFGTTTGLTTGSYAEYICVPEDGVLATLPANVTYEEAAPVPIGALTALHFLRKGDVATGKKVLVYGASGSVGSFAVQLATHFGARVTGVCSTSNVEMVKALGAEKVIDYTRQDFTTAGRVYDVIFDAVGKSSPKRRKRVLAGGWILRFDPITHQGETRGSAGSQRSNGGGRAQGSHRHALLIGADDGIRTRDPHLGKDLLPCGHPS